MDTTPQEIASILHDSRDYQSSSAAVAHGEIDPAIVDPNDQEEQSHHNSTVSAAGSKSHHSPSKTTLPASHSERACSQRAIGGFNPKEVCSETKVGYVCDAAESHRRVHDANNLRSALVCESCLAEQPDTKDTNSRQIQSPRSPEATTTRGEAAIENKSGREVGGAPVDMGKADFNQYGSHCEGFQGAIRMRSEVQDDARTGELCFLVTDVDAHNVVFSFSKHENL